MVWKRDYPAEPALLQWCEHSVREEAEREWIGTFSDLLNERKNPWAWFYARVRKPPAVIEINAYRRRYLFNAGGFHGVSSPESKGAFASLSFISVSGFFAKLTKKRLKRGVFRSLRELKDAIHRFLDHTNANPKPFTWTKNPNKIIAAVRRGHQVLDSIH
jgi:hypothetical protein